MSELDATPHLRLAVRGEIDAATARSGIDLLVRADPSPGDAVTLDLSDVEFIDSSGVSMLLIRSYLDGIGCRFALTNPQPQLCASSRSSASPRSSQPTTHRCQARRPLRQRGRVFRVARDGTCPAGQASLRVCGGAPCAFELACVEKFALALDPGGAQARGELA